MAANLGGDRIRDVANLGLADVCVIGTGAGGGVMLQELTEAGFDVVALERGPALSLSQFMSDDELSVVLGAVFSLCLGRRTSLERGRLNRPWSRAPKYR